MKYGQDIKITVDVKIHVIYYMISLLSTNFGVLFGTNQIINPRKLSCALRLGQDLPIRKSRLIHLYLGHSDLLLEIFTLKSNAKISSV